MYVVGARSLLQFAVDHVDPVGSPKLLEGARLTEVSRRPSKNRIANWFSDSPRGLLGTLADLVGVGTALFVAGSLVVTQGVVPAILAAALSLIAVSAILLVWRLETALRQRDQTDRLQDRLASAIPSLSASIAGISRANVALTSGGPGASRTFVQYCEAACKDFAAAMHALTGRPCRVTLQEVYVPEQGPDDDFAVKTIASSYNPQPGHARSPIDRVEDNSDFATLMAGANIYHCNDLVEEVSAGYRNSHWTSEKLSEWKRTGEYPYRSTVVWPLREMVELGPGHDRTWDLAGFLSVDSAESGTFNRDTVHPLGEAVAHAAYSGLVLYRLWSRDAS